MDTAERSPVSVPSPLGSSDPLAATGVSVTSFASSDGGAAVGSELSLGSETHRARADTEASYESSYVGPESIEELVHRLIDNGEREIDLSDRELGEEGIRQLKAAVLDEDHRAQLQELNLGRASLSDTSFQILGDLLFEAPSLTHLDLSGNIPDSPRKALGGSFFDGLLTYKKGGSIRNLSFKGCRLRDHGMEAVSKIFAYIPGPLDREMMLSHLDLSDNRIGLEGLQLLKRGFKECERLRVLNLSANSMGPECSELLVECIDLNSAPREPGRPEGCIERLELSQNKLQRDGVHELATHFISPKGQLLYLDLTHNSVPYTDLTEIRDEIARPIDGLLKGWIVQYGSAASGRKRQLVLNAF